uniref:Acyltransf_C domain-containing protein n=1 Tax=Globodera pallida TaxID=36090 RepID=A0A183CQM9_GLOPA
MRERNYLAHVYDVTVAYPGKLVQNETDMIIRGQLARNVHFDVRRISAEQLPSSDEELHQWIMELEHFYTERIPSRRRFESAGGEGNCWSRDGWAQLAVKVFGFCFWVSSSFTLS